MIPSALFNPYCMFCVFTELYEPTGENLGEGAFGSVLTYRNIITNLEYAVKVRQNIRQRSSQYTRV